MAPHVTAADFGGRDLAFAAFALVSVGAIVVAQGLWIVIADTTGFDRAVPDLLFASLLPALTVTAAPAAIGAWLYARRIALVTAASVFLAAFALSTATIELFTLCGRGC